MAINTWKTNNKLIRTVTWVSHVSTTDNRFGTVLGTAQHAAPATGVLPHVQQTFYNVYVLSMLKMSGPTLHLLTVIKTAVASYVPLVTTLFTSSLRLCRIEYTYVT